MKTLGSIGLVLAALAAMSPAFSQIRTPYNSYPPTFAEREQTAELNRQSGQDGWRASRYPAQDQAEERYQRRLQHYHQQIRRYRRSEGRYWHELRSRDAGYDRPYRSDPSYGPGAERIVDSGIVGKQIQILTGDYAGHVVGVDRDASRKVEGLYVRLHGGKVIWLDVGNVRYDGPYGVIYTDLNPSALLHMPDERS